MSIDSRDFYLRFKEYIDWNINNLYQSKDTELLHTFISKACGFTIPTIKICPTHCAPFDFVADSFFDVVSKMLVIANRNGGKTQNFGILNAIDALCKNNCEIASVGAIEDQAAKCYKYTSGILTKPYFKDMLIKDPMVSKTNLRNSSEISILPGTMAGVNGPHPQRTNFDEVELTQWKVLQEFMSMAKSTPDVPSCVRITSTRKFSHGPMQQLIDEQEERGFKMYIWCIWETIEHCPDIRSGKVPCTLTIYNEKLRQLRKYPIFSNNKLDYNKEFPLDIVKKNREKYSGCLACPLVEVCLCKSKKADGYYMIKDVIDKFTGMDRTTWDTQWECLKPGTSGLVYGEFDDTIHVIPQESFKLSLTNGEITPGQDWGLNSWASCMATYNKKQLVNQ